MRKEIIISLVAGFCGAAMLQASLPIIARAVGPLTGTEVQVSDVAPAGAFRIYPSSDTMPVEMHEPIASPSRMAGDVQPSLEDPTENRSWGKAWWDILNRNKLHASGWAAIGLHAFNDKVKLMALSSSPETAVPLSIGTAATDNIWLTANGNVGIGRPNPLAALDVNGYARVIRPVAGNCDVEGSFVYELSTHRILVCGASARWYILNMTLRPIIHN